MNLKKIDLAVVASLVLMVASFWQLEIVYIVASNPLSWGYNFAGLGDLGLQLYTWRDIWYLLICVSWALMFIWREKK